MFGLWVAITAQKIKFSFKDFPLTILSHLLKKSLMQNFIFCAVWAAVVEC